MTINRQQLAERHGFALIVSIALMSLLLLLVISLATLTTLETQTATHTREEIEAQQNALAALGIALGQLQKYAGPDQRVTARADLQGGAGSANAYWTGVYGSSIAANYADTPETIATDLTDPTKVDTDGTGSPAQLLSWLVSGNESISFNPSTDVGASGEIISAPETADIPFPASAAVSGLAGATATSKDITIAGMGGSQPARMLVGPGSTGDESDYVVAPLVEMEGDGGSTTGRYAWWIGDEGVKARANLPLVTKDEDKLNAFVNASRTAVELMATGPSAAAELDGPRIESLYNPMASTLTRSEERMDLPFTSSSPDDFADQLKYRFHDLTTHSQSVIADVYAGGLKRDLSILLDESYAPAPDDPTADTNRMWVPHSGDTTLYGIPTWKHLRSFAQTRVSTSGLSNMAMSPVRPAYDKEDGSPDHVGVAPVITYFSMGIRVAPAIGANDTPADGDGINMNLYPVVIIWNPYNFTIKAPEPYDGGGNYEVGIFPHYNVQLSLDVEKDNPAYDPFNPESTEPKTIWEKKCIFDFQKDTSKEIRSHQYDYIRFRLNCPDILPGQSLIFALPNATAGSLYDETNILENIDPKYTTYVSIPISTIGNDEANKRFRLRPDGNRGSSFANRGGGQLYMYIGEPVDYWMNGMPTNDRAHDLRTASRLWYQANQLAGFDKNHVETMVDPNAKNDEMSVLQGPAKLEAPSTDIDPSFVFLMQALFSGYNSNAKLNADQHMLTSRWIAQGNMRAPRTSRTRRDRNYNVLYTATAGTDVPWKKFQNGQGPSERASAGLGHDWINNAPVDAVLFEFPYEDQPILSIGQLQHANLSLIGSYPSYPIGNSLADFRLRPESGPLFDDAPPGYQLARIDHVLDQNSHKIGLQRDMEGYYDVSYLLNRTLWDQYFFSSVPATGAVPEALANPRHVKYNDSKDLQNPDQVAAGLMLEGGFNINSTSEQAWRAILGGNNQLAFDPEHQTSGNSLKTSFPRFTRPTSGVDPNEAFEGYRTLSEEQIAQLAHNIVAEVRKRGPFVSMADFINRRLVDNPMNNDSNPLTGPGNEHEHFKGTLQAAIDGTVLSSDGTDGAEIAFPVNDGSLTFWTNQDELANDIQREQWSYIYERQKVWGGDAETHPYSNRAAFAPKFITQADILATIGSSLSARSDTFVIRAYGEVTNPYSPDEVRAQAWCEAVVQRYPEYQNDTDLPEEDPSVDINQWFGRKFKIVSFRWLSADEV